MLQPWDVALYGAEHLDLQNGLTNARQSLRLMRSLMGAGRVLWQTHYGLMIITMTIIFLGMIAPSCWTLPSPLGKLRLLRLNGSAVKARRYVQRAH